MKKRKVMKKKTQHAMPLQHFLEGVWRKLRMHYTRALPF